MEGISVFGGDRYRAVPRGLIYYYLNLETSAQSSSRSKPRYQVPQAARQLCVLPAAAQAQRVAHLSWGRRVGSYFAVVDIFLFPSGFVHFG